MEWSKATKLKKSSIVKDNKTNTITSKKSKSDDSNELKAPSTIREKSDQESQKKQSIKTKQSKIKLCIVIIHPRLWPTFSVSQGILILSIIGAHK